MNVCTRYQALSICLRLLINISHAFFLQSYERNLVLKMTKFLELAVLQFRLICFYDLNRNNAAARNLTFLRLNLIPPVLLKKLFFEIFQNQ